MTPGRCPMPPAHCPLPYFALSALLLLSIVSQSACRPPEPRGINPDAGISLALARQRTSSIDHLRYQLAFDIPLAQTDPIEGRVTIRFTSRDLSQPLILDFDPGPSHVKSVAVAGK